MLLLDKTGTITLATAAASAFLPLPGVNIDEMMQAACPSSGDETPEGRSIIELGALRPLKWGATRWSACRSRRKPA